MDPAADEICAAVLGLIMDLQLVNKVVLISGSSRGIGKAIAQALLQAGCRVCITGRTPATLQAAGAELKQAHGERVLSIMGDFTEPATMQSALETVHRVWGKLDILVANLGGGRGQTGWQVGVQEWLRVFQLNFFSAVNLTELALPYLQKNGGNILFIASIVALESLPAPLPYSAAKAALANYSKNLSRQVAASGIRVNCLAPGNIYFPGGSWEHHLENRKAEVSAYIAAEVAQQRFGMPEEIANFAAFLLSPLCAFATGGYFVLDGGQSRRIG